VEEAVIWVVLMAFGIGVMFGMILSAWASDIHVPTNHEFCEYRYARMQEKYRQELRDKDALIQALAGKVAKTRKEHPIC